MTEPNIPDFETGEASHLGRLAKESRDDPSDPGGTLRALGISMEAHFGEDARNWRLTRWYAGVMLIAVLAGAAALAAAQSERAEIREHQATQAETERQIDARLQRIEAQLDRLVERR